MAGFNAKPPINSIGSSRFPHPHLPAGSYHPSVSRQVSGTLDRVKEKTLPRLASLSTPTCPPSFSTIRCTIDSPSPCPLACTWSSRVNGVAHRPLPTPRVLGLCTSAERVTALCGTPAAHFWQPLSRFRFVSFLLRRPYHTRQPLPLTSLSSYPSLSWIVPLRKPVPIAATQKRPPVFSTRGLSSSIPSRFSDSCYSSIVNSLPSPRPNTSGK